jgi:hypothetical protein
MPACAPQPLSRECLRAMCYAKQLRVRAPPLEMACGLTYNTHARLCRLTTPRPDVLERGHRKQLAVGREPQARDAHGAHALQEYAEPALQEYSEPALDRLRGWEGGRPRAARRGS